MSDFDKEAEREKLREKYERDKAEREATQRMSDLLLKGATMTNAHCGTCGDPLFKENGTTFCPSCHGNPDAVQGTELEAQPAEASSEDTDGDRDGATTGDSTDDERPVDADTQDAGEPTTDATRDRQREQPSSSNSQPTSTADASDQPASSPTPSSSVPRSDDTRDRSRRSTDDDRPSRDRSPAASRPTGGDRTAAHASLMQALEKWADEAAIADDPRYAKECLEAAREASETLNSLR